jgi:benzodiazapine receptor
MKKNKYLSLFLILIITFIASGIGGFVTASFKEPWYSEIILPSFNPPSWVFAPIWTSLYILMSIAIWKVWINFYDKKILNIYFIHLFFNATWSIVFFGFHQIELALKKDKMSFYLTIPYFFWSSYALILNFSIVLLN